MATKETPPASPLVRLTARLPAILQQTGHDEMWGVTLSTDEAHAPSQVVLQKFLRANGGDAAAAEKQLTRALAWRRKSHPAANLANCRFSRAKFDKLGFVTVHPDETAAWGETVITWNIYGAVKNNKATFGDVQEFLAWRAALMELGVQKLRLNEITEPLGEGAEDPYRMLQVHDYRSVSFFRMDPDVKNASRETIDTMSMAYPELLAHKYFVNVPAIMGWMFGAMKLFLAPATLRKFHPMTSGTSLATELKGITATLPVEYGGQGPSVETGFTVPLTQDETAEKQEEVIPAGSAEAPVATVAGGNAEPQVEKHTGEERIAKGQINAPARAFDEVPEHIPGTATQGIAKSAPVTNQGAELTTNATTTSDPDPTHAAQQRSASGPYTGGSVNEKTRSLEIDHIDSGVSGASLHKPSLGVAVPESDNKPASTKPQTSDEETNFAVSAAKVAAKRADEGGL